MSILAALMALSVALRALADSDLWVPIAIAAAASLCVMTALPYVACVHRSIKVDLRGVTFQRPFGSNSVRFDEIAACVSSSWGPDPQLRLLAMDGRRIHVLHLSYWPDDLEREMRDSVALGRVGELSGPPAVRPR